MYDGISGGDGAGEIETPAPQDQVAKIVGDAKLESERMPIASVSNANESSSDNFWLLVILVVVIAGLAWGGHLMGRF